MPATRKIQVFSAGCAVCDDTISLINRLACSSCEVEVLDMRDAAVAKKAKRYDVGSIPAVVVDGKLADYCVGRAPRDESLRTAGLGDPR